MKRHRFIIGNYTAHLEPYSEVVGWRVRGRERETQRERKWAWGSAFIGFKRRASSFTGSLSIGKLTT